MMMIEIETLVTRVLILCDEHGRKRGLRQRQFSEFAIFREANSLASAEKNHKPTSVESRSVGVLVVRVGAV